MTEDGLAKVPTQISPEILTRITTLETELAALKQEVGLVKDTKATTDHYGLAKICPVDATNITVADGLVCGAEEKNPNIEGTFANQIQKIITNGYYALSGGTPIRTNEDLNRIQTLGNYYCALNDIAVTLKNSPTNMAFIMKVEMSDGVKQPSQTLKAYRDGTTYYRFLTGVNLWTEWKKITA